MSSSLPATSLPATSLPATSLPAALPSGTVTFLFTDIAGSTRLWQEHPDAMPDVLARHDALLQQAIELHGGHVFKTVGDAFCAAFSQTPQALQTALAIQIALAQEPWPAGLTLAVRIALHTGTAQHRDADYFGPTLNRLARLIAIAHGGQTLLSLTTQLLVCDHLPPQAALQDRGEHRLKDLARPEHVFEMLHPALPAGFPPLRSLDSPALPNNLPSQATSFVGREHEMAHVKTLLQNSRLLTLVGAGGAGKTRLSLQVAADLLTGDGDGVWLVELAAITDPALVPQSVADVLGVQEEAGVPLARTLTAWLKPKNLLLILDNCEHVVGACASLAAEVLRHCPQVHLLASSREPLGVAGEQVYRMPMLSLPNTRQGGAGLNVDVLMQSEAARLFAERAQAASASFAVTAGNARAVGEVCHRLDGIPLAIELAAARVRSLPVEEVNARLDNRFRLLTGGVRTALPRQQTLRALVDWSYELLTGDEKRLLARLSVFAGGWTLSAAEGVCAFGEVEDYEVLDGLTSLVDKSLVVYEEDGRYRLLETIRQYAKERLDESGDGDTARAHHRQWFYDLAGKAEANLEGADLGIWLARLGADLDNLRAALDCGLEHAPQDKEVAVQGVQAVAALRVFWRARALTREGHAYAGAALAANPDVRDTDAVKEQLSVLALIHSYNRDQVAAARLMEERLAWCRARGHLAGVIHTLFNYATVLDRAGDAAGARGLSEECLREIEQAALSGSMDEAALQSYRVGVEGNLAVGYWDAGDYAQAHALLFKNVPVFRSMGNADWLTQCLLSVGALLMKPWHGRDLAEAERYLREGTGLGAGHGQREQMLAGVSDFALLRAAQGRWAEAATLAGATESSRKEMDVSLSGAQAEEWAALSADIRAALGDSAFSHAWSAGQAMTLEQAVACALLEAA